MALAVRTGGYLWKRALEGSPFVGQEKKPCVKSGGNGYQQMWMSVVHSSGGELRSLVILRGVHM